MTSEQFQAKIKVLITEIGPKLETECLRLLRSGAVDTDTFADDFTLPRMILSVALETAAKEWKPFDEMHRQERNNLRKF